MSPNLPGGSMGSKTPRGERLSIALIGRRNVGKSSLINALTGQEIAIVDDHPGTTTDPVAKPFELLPFGPVTFYDTAGIDDIGGVGEKRVRASLKILWRSDIALLVTDSKGLGPDEKNIIGQLDKTGIPFLILFNKSDSGTPPFASLELCQEKKYPFVFLSTKNGDGIKEAREKVITLASSLAAEERPLIRDILRPGETVLLITPIDPGAPKGRLILPQVQVLRDILDGDALAFTAKETDINRALSTLKEPPSLVITDSQVIGLVDKHVPESIPLTTFSTAFARYKGELAVLAEGARLLDTLKDGDSLLIAEACSHHVRCDDIGRVKIPRWLKDYTGKELNLTIAAGHDFPDDLEKFSLVIHCGGCMLTATEMKRRMRQCLARGVPVTNYGVAISKMHGVLDRIVRPFGL